MSDEFDDLVDRWMRDRGAVEPPAVEAVRGAVAALPSRPRRSRLAPPAAVAVIAVALGLAALSIGVVPRHSGPASLPSAPVPPDPAAFAGDPRLARCGASVDAALDAFEMAHARDYRLHLPAMLLSPELDVDAPAFVVVFRQMQSFPGGAPPPPGQTWPPRSPAPGHHDVCVLIGDDPATAERNIYDDVDTSGLTVTIEGPAASEGRPASAAPTASTVPPSGVVSITPEPGPAWAGDPTAALDCDDPLGAARPPIRDTSFAALVPDDERLLRFYLQSVRSHRDPFPIAGWVERERTPSARLFAVVAAGRAKAALVVSSRVTGSAEEWVVSAVAACDPAELDPATPTGRDPIGIWTDATGAPVPSGTLAGTFDCYDGTQVRYRNRLYVRIPFGGVDAAQLETSWAGDAAIPSTARAAPVRSGDLRLFVAADGRAIYLGANGRGERLPHVIGDEVVRTDCN